jgi:tetratricopeptide (TPR) repeat protein
MNLSDTLKKAIEEYLAASEKEQNTSRIDSAYWALIADSFAECVRYKKDLHAVITDMKDLIDFGICPEMLKNGEVVKATITPSTAPSEHLKVTVLSTFIEDRLNTILQESSRERIEKEIAIAERERSRHEKELLALQEIRKELLFSAFNASPKTGTIAEQMDMVDELQFFSLTMKKSVVKGAFVTVEKKREHFTREKNITEMQSKIDRFLSSDLAQKANAEQIRQQSADINVAIEIVIDQEAGIAKLREEIDRIEREQRTISGLELENRIRIEIDYLKDLVRLSARRLHTTSCPLLRKDDSYFSFDELAKCLNRVLEFDPHVFQNERTVHFGKPSILLIPGNGNALYDWKNNQIMVPLVPYQKNFMASIASGIIEYRFDTDEEKKLLNSFNLLPENKTIKSVVQLKSKLIKEYTLWMTSEYAGFRVLSTLSKKWFEREIAPSRNDIYTPFAFQPFELPSAQFQKLLEKIESEVTDRQNAPQESLWTGSVLEYQRGNYEKAYELVSELVKRDPSRDFAWYNYGHTALKAMRKKEAIEAFNQFIKMRSQSWWTSVAYDWVRQLQIG